MENKVLKTKAEILKALNKQKCEKIEIEYGECNIELKPKVSIILDGEEIEISDKYIVEEKENKK